MGGEKAISPADLRFTILRGPTPGTGRNLLGGDAPSPAHALDDLVELVKAGNRGDDIVYGWMEDGVIISGR